MRSLSTYYLQLITYHLVFITYNFLSTKKGIMKPSYIWALALALILDTGVAAAASPLDLDYQTIQMKDTKKEGMLILSDSPEYVEQTGILAEGTIKGTGRIYYYHVNSTGDTARLVVYAENKTNAPLDAKVTKFLQGAPSIDYITSGATLSYNEMVSVHQNPVPVTLEPGKRVIIAEEDANGLLPDYLYTGLVEVETKQPVHFGTAMLPMSDNGALTDALQAAQPVPVDSHEMRGTFPMSVHKESVKVWDADKDGPAALVYGSSDTHDFYSGPDELDGVTRENTGNYGTNVYMKVKTRGTSKFHVYFNPLGGVYMGAFKMSQGFLPHYFRTDDMKYGGHWLGDGTWEDYIDTGVWEAGKPLTIEFMSAGATYLPVRFLFVPEGVKQ